MAHAPQTPYTKDLGAREPLSAMREASERIGSLVSGWTPAQFERSYAPGKWTARQILVHLVQTEVALGNRARMALATPGFTSQAFDQDRWMTIEGSSGSGASGGSGRSSGSRGLATPKLDSEATSEGGSGKFRGASGNVAAQALVAMNAVNRALFESLTPAERATPFSHPEYGALTVDWLIHQMAGHLVHHLEQMETIAGAD